MICDRCGRELKGVDTVVIIGDSRLCGLCFDLEVDEMQTEQIAEAMGYEVAYAEEFYEVNEDEETGEH